MDEDPPFTPTPKRWAVTNACTATPYTSAQSAMRLLPSIEQSPYQLGISDSAAGTASKLPAPLFLLTKPSQGLCRSLSRRQQCLDHGRNYAGDSEH